jgi:hypothetical protein
VLCVIPENTGGCFPNADNKYIAGANLCFEPEKVIVVRSKAAAFPDTHSGAPVWQPPGQFTKVQVRYWSMCNNDQVKPFPVVACEMVLMQHFGALYAIRCSGGHCRRC